MHLAGITAHPAHRRRAVNRRPSCSRPIRVEWDCTGGPPGWPGTRIVWTVEPTDAGVVVRLDHTGFDTVDDMFRIVTVGWAQMLLSLREYLASGVRKPFFDF